MMILDLDVCSDRVLDDPGAFQRLMLKVGALKVLEFLKFGLE